MTSAAAIKTIEHLRLRRSGALNSRRVLKFSAAMLSLIIIISLVASVTVLRLAPIICQPLISHWKLFAMITMTIMMFFFSKLLTWILYRVPFIQRGVILEARSLGNRKHSYRLNLLDTQLALLKYDNLKYFHLNSSRINIDSPRCLHASYGRNYWYSNAANTFKFFTFSYVLFIAHLNINSKYYFTTIKYVFHNFSIRQLRVSL